MTILTGIRIIEIEGIGPGPFCGKHLAELGAEVVAIVRPGSVSASEAETPQLMRAGKTLVELDLKDNTQKNQAFELISKADGLIEGMRPGVMERLGLGPDVCMEANPRLAYGRMTGWGQTGPLGHTAGHDLNYIALSGALWYSGQPGTAPFSPPTVIGDVGGALYLTIGLLSAILAARITGKGDVIDAAIVDSSAHMLNLLNSMRPLGLLSDERGKSFLDGPHWYDTYRCADGQFFSIGALEPKFYTLLIELLGLTDDPAFTDQMDVSQWPAQKEKLAALFATKPREHWETLLSGTDACVAPVLTITEAAAHPHNQERKIYYEHAGHLSAAAAPRFAMRTSSETKICTIATAREALHNWRA